VSAPRETRPVSDTIIAAAAIASARFAGCNCAPLIQIWNDADGLGHVNVAHDDWCQHPSMQRGRDA